MEAQIKKILAETFARYQSSGLNRSEFYDITLSIVSWISLSCRQDELNSNSLKIPVSFKKVMQAYDKKIFFSALESWENYEGPFWTGLLKLDMALIDDIADNIWEFTLTAWGDLFTTFSLEQKTFVSKVFHQLEQDTTFEQKDEYAHITPQEVTSIMGYYIASEKKGTLYDPFARTGNLLLEALKRLPLVEKIVGFAPMNLAWKLAKLRLLFASETRILDIQKDWKYQEQSDKKFDFIISNPPFGQQIVKKQQPIDITSDWLDLVNRSNRIDIYYLCHILSHLADEGRASVLLPSIFLSSNAVIKELIKRLLDRNILDAVVELPAGLFAHTGVSTVMLCISKCRMDKDYVLLADASKEIIRDGKHTILKSEKILAWFDNLKFSKQITEVGQTAMVTRSQIAQKDFKLNVNAYNYTNDFVKNRMSSEELRRQYEELETKIEKARAAIKTFLLKN